MTIERRRFDGIVLEEPQEGILLMTLNRPERLNALTFEMFDALNELQAAVAADPRVRVLIVSGAGRGFSRGSISTTQSGSRRCRRRRCSLGKRGGRGQSPASGCCRPR